MSANRALARIKQWCCLGLDSQAIMPALLRELHELVPSYANQFLWADEHQAMSNFFAENIEEIAPHAPLYLREFHNRRENDVISGFTESLRSRRGVLTENELLKVDLRHYYQHDFYNLVVRPSGYDHALRGIIDEGGPALGGVILNRAPGEPDFTTRDRLRLGSIIPYLAHTLATPPSSPEAPLVDSDDEGLVIVDVTGRVQDMCGPARRLLALASHFVMSEKAMLDGFDATVLPPGAAHLCARLVNIFASQAKEAQPPVWRCRNAWGGFVFRAFWLNNHAPEPSPRIGITIKRQEPLQLKLLRHMEQLPLTDREEQVCLLLAAGHTRPSIAERMDISRHTAVTYTRHVYDKLQVHNRAELVNKLLSL